MEHNGTCRMSNTLSETASYLFSSLSPFLDASRRVGYILFANARTRYVFDETEGSVEIFEDKCRTVEDNTMNCFVVGDTDIVRSFRNLRIVVTILIRGAKKIEKRNLCSRVKL